MNNEQIFIFKPDALGDFILATSAIRFLRNQFPRSQIVLLVSPTVFSIARWCVDADIVLPVGQFLLQNINNDIIKETANSVRRLAGIDDLRHASGVNLRWDVDYYGAGPLMYSLGIGRRIGYSESVNLSKTRLNKGYDFFYTQILVDKGVEHEVIKNNKIAAHMANGKFSDSFGSSPINSYVTKWHQENAEYLLRSLNLLGCDVVCVGIGASKAFKQLAIWQWVELLSSLSKPGRKFLILGGETDRLSGERLCSAIPNVISIAGKVDPLGVIPFLLRSKLCICTDSFVKHIAAAVGTVTVELSSHSKAGDSESEYGGMRFGAWETATYVLKPETHANGCDANYCRANEPHCILGLDLTAAADLVDRLLEGRRTSHCPQSA